MGRQRWTVIGMACWFLTAASASAGLYFADDVIPWPPPDEHKPFMIELNRLKNALTIKTDAPAAEDAKRDISALPPTAGERVRRTVLMLLNREKDGLLSLDDRINLSAYLVLLGRYDRAQEVLSPDLNTAAARTDFRVHANLAIIAHHLNNLEEATVHQRHALENWPAIYPGWNAKRLAWYRRVEEYYLALLNARNVEVLRRLPQDTIDEIFPGVRFAERRGDYLIGGMSDALRAQLPPDALAIVRQLLFWLPTDQRLLWLYAELLNANGEAAAAFQLMDAAVFSTGLNFPLLREHRSAHFRFSQMLPLSTQYRLFYVGMPSPLGVAVYERGRAELLGEVDQTNEIAGYVRTVLQGHPLATTICAGILFGPPKPDPSTPMAQKKDDADDGSSGVSSLPDWRPLLAGFAAGIVVGVLAVFQVRLLRRKRA